MTGRLVITTVLAGWILAACSAQPTDTRNGSHVAAATPAIAKGPAPNAGPTPVATRSFAGFWNAFRDAALAGDAKRIAGFSASSVVQHGMLDDDPKTLLQSHQVAAVLAKLLEDPASTAMSELSLKATLAATDIPKRRPDEPLGYRWVGPLVFEQKDGRWSLTEIYVEN